MDESDLYAYGESGKFDKYIGCDPGEIVVSVLSKRTEKNGDIVGMKLVCSNGKSQELFTRDYDPDYDLTYWKAESPDGIIDRIITFDDLWYSTVKFTGADGKIHLATESFMTRPEYPHKCPWGGKVQGVFKTSSDFEYERTPRDDWGIVCTGCDPKYNSPDYTPAPDNVILYLREGYDYIPSEPVEIGNCDKIPNLMALNKFLYIDFIKIKPGIGIELFEKTHFKGKSVKLKETTGKFDLDNIIVDLRKRYDAGNIGQSMRIYSLDSPTGRVKFSFKGPIGGADPELELKKCCIGAKDAVNDCAKYQADPEINKIKCKDHLSNFCGVYEMDSLECKKFCQDNPGECDQSALEYCDNPDNITDPFCSCIRNISADISPSCFNETCAQSGYKTREIMSKDCPSELSCVDVAELREDGLLLSNSSALVRNCKERFGGRTATEKYVEGMQDSDELKDSDELEEKKSIIQMNIWIWIFILILVAVLGVIAGKSKMFFGGSPSGWTYE